jgi:hypothetical protein
MDGSRDEALFKGKKFKWALNKFKPYKSPETDRILPALLQKGGLAKRFDTYQNHGEV